MPNGYIQDYFVDRTGYRCGRCGRTGFTYAGEPHTDASGRVCEPPNKLADPHPRIEVQHGGTPSGALPQVSNVTLPGTEDQGPGKLPVTDQVATLSTGTTYNPAADPADPAVTPSVPTPAATSVETAPATETVTDFPVLRPIQIDANGDVIPN